MQPIARDIANFLCVFEKRMPGGVLCTTIYYDSRALKREVATNRIVVGHRELFAVAKKRLGDYAVFERPRLSEQQYVIPKVVAVLGDELLVAYHPFGGISHVGAAYRRDHIVVIRPVAVVLTYDSICTSILTDITLTSLPSAREASAA